MPESKSSEQEQAASRQQAEEKKRQQEVVNCKEISAEELINATHSGEGSTGEDFER